ncbi:hypothetical protein ACIBVL_33025 [Streptomyces sp. NPDC049687]|uniref:hypothetical protein n=1 Tax=Streptomyces sp. NPDC049687 TaxID=3365596 RepID=UPI0037B52D7A
MSPGKEFLEVAKAGDFLGKFHLGAAASGAAVGLISGLLTKFKEISLAITGRQRTLGSFWALRTQRPFAT